MENNTSVPVKTKIAALMLIGAGIAIAVVFLFSFFDIGPFRIGPVAEFKYELLPQVTGLAGIALIIALFSFLSGLPLFARQKRQLLLHASMVFLAAYAILFALWKGIIALYWGVLNSAGCPIIFDQAAMETPTCLANSDAINFSLNFLFLSTAGTIVVGFLVFFLVYSGLQIMKLNKNWRNAAIALMAINVLTLGNAALSTLSSMFYYQENVVAVDSLPVSIALAGFSLAVIILLLLDRKKFSAKKDK